MPTYQDDTSAFDQVISQGYEFKMGYYFSEGWQIFRQQMWAFWGFTLLATLALALVAQFPILGAFAQIFLGGVMYAGLFIVANNIRKGKAFEFSDFFRGTDDVLQLGLTQLVTGLIAILPMLLTFLLAFDYSKAWALYTREMTDPNEISEFALSLFTDWRIYVGLLATIFLSLLYIFALPLVALGRLKFWPAMEVSRKTVSQQWWNFLLMNVLFTPVLLIGLLVLCLGIYAAMAYMYCVIYVAYTDIYQVEGSSAENIIDEIGSN
ncbi:MAG: hypothetical protein EAZ89_12070 [Bacteroidetes bacterium]|nr:MAG: hypothetical protein EAZ89_12070 [Bacteroidota bacterium]